MAELSHVRTAAISTAVVASSWLNTKIIELVLARPPGFNFIPGQKIILTIDGVNREYSLANAPGEDLVLCVRYVPQGAMSEKLTKVKKGDVLKISEAYGYFVHRSGSSVFVATGTGAVPFASFAKSGVTDFTMLHGAECADDLFYCDLFQASAFNYIPCITNENTDTMDKNLVYSGRVTRYLDEKLGGGPYNFYLCGNGNMIKDAIEVIDNRFKGSRIFTETFFV